MSVEQIIVPASPEVIAEWQSHFAEGVSDDKDMLTAAELAKIAGISKRRMLIRLESGLLDGTYESGRAYRQDAAGRRQLVPVYKLVKKATKRRRK